MTPSDPGRLAARTAGRSAPKSKQATLACPKRRGKAKFQWRATDPRAGTGSPRSPIKFGDAARHRPSPGAVPAGPQPPAPAGCDPSACLVDSDGEFAASWRRKFRTVRSGLGSDGQGRAAPPRGAGPAGGVRRRRRGGAGPPRARPLPACGRDARTSIF